MPKMKTKSSCKKRFTFTGTGKVRRNPAGKRHNLRKRTAKFIRQARGPETMKEVDARIVRGWMPYR